MKHWQITNTNNRIENKITFKIKTGYHLQLFTSETLKLLWSKKKISKDKNGEKVPHLDVTDVVLFHCNNVKTDYKQDFRVLRTFFPNKSFGMSLEISPTNAKFSNLLSSEFSHIQIWSTDQNSRPPKKEDRINLALAEMRNVVETRDRISI